MSHRTVVAPTPLLLVAAAALVDAGDRVLVQQRPAAGQHGGLWEFPGGKIEAGESPDHSVVRELREELGIDVMSQDMDPVGFASHSDQDRHLVLLLYLVRRWTGEPRPLQAAALAWHSIADIAALPMPPADRPLVAMLARQI